MSLVPMQRSQEAKLWCRVNHMNTLLCSIGNTRFISAYHPCVLQQQARSAYSKTHTGGNIKIFAQKGVRQERTQQGITTLMIFRLLNIATLDLYWNSLITGAPWDSSVLQKTHWHQFMYFLGYYISNKSSFILLLSVMHSEKIVKKTKRKPVQFSITVTPLWYH